MAPALPLSALLVLLAQVTVGPRPRPSPLAPVARVLVVERTVEHGRRGGWEKEDQAFALAPGERVRTGGQGLALVSLPWMEILVGPGSVVALAPSAVLAAWLETGRVEQRARGQILKVTTAEAVVRGGGRVVVRRREGEAAATLVSSLDGSFAVSAGAEVVDVASGRGLVVRGGRVQEVDLPAAPAGLLPGQDPAYVRRGQPVRLSWTGPGRRFYVEVATLGGDEVLLAREVAGHSLDLPLDWRGTFLWRVSAVDADGLEGPPSAPGYICVVDE